MSQPAQSQPTPSCTDRMQPRSNLGKEGYKRSSKLADRGALLRYAIPGGGLVL